MGSLMGPCSSEAFSRALSEARSRVTRFILSARVLNGASSMFSQDLSGSKQQNRCFKDDLSITVFLMKSRSKSTDFPQLGPSFGPATNSVSFDTA